MKKLDLKKQLKHLYAASPNKVEIVYVPKLNFAMIDGEIEPNQTPGTSEEFQNSVGALYGVTFTLKFMSKLRKKTPIDYPVMALEWLWWTDSGEFDFKKKGAVEMDNNDHAPKTHHPKYVSTSITAS
jgi:hypothetical protein